jgi:hypothetical protein
MTEIEKLKAEIEEAKEILKGGSLVDGEGNDIPTSLKERATYMSMIVQSEADMADRYSQELDEIRDKYNKLLVNFKELDRYNDVLYRLFYVAKRLRNSGYDGPFIGDVAKELFGCIAEVERHERELVQSRKKENISN